MIDAGAHADQFDLSFVGSVDQLTWSMSNAISKTLLCKRHGCLC